MKSNVEYMKVFMEYESDDMPVVYYYEVDLENEQLALRAIEVYWNREVSIIDDLYHDVIEIVPIPTVNELNSKVWGEGFYATVISKEEFETLWHSHQYNGELSIS